MTMDKAPRKRRGEDGTPPAADDAPTPPQAEEIDWSDEDEAAANAAWAKLGPIFQAEDEAKRKKESGGA